MFFSVTLPGGGHMNSFEISDSLLEQLSEEFNVKEDNILFLSFDYYELVPESVLDLRDIRPKQLTFLQCKEETIIKSLLKSRPLIGVTICDGGFGWSIVRDVWKESDAEKAGIRTGDAIQSVNGEILRGRGHFETAKKLRDIKIGGATALTLYRPKTAGFGELAIFIWAQWICHPFIPLKTNIKPRGRREQKREHAYKIDETGPISELIAILVDYLGVHDCVLAELILNIGKRSQGVDDLKATLETSEDMPPFELSDDMYQRMWAAISPMSHCLQCCEK